MWPIGHRSKFWRRIVVYQNCERSHVRLGAILVEGQQISRHTYNARSETVAVKRSYRAPWKKRRYCLVPMAGFYEPDYETGRPIRWRIERQDQDIFTVAAIWDYWRNPEGSGLTSFSLLTINSDGHPVVGGFHAPGDDKRSLVIIPPECRERWLNATPMEAGAFLQPMPPEEFTAYPDPTPSAKRS